MPKIIGNITATPYPRPDWNQTDETRVDYIKNKPNTDSIEQNVSSHIKNTSNPHEVTASQIVMTDGTSVEDELINLRMSAETPQEIVGSSRGVEDGSITIPLPFKSKLYLGKDGYLAYVERTYTDDYYDPPNVFTEKHYLYDSYNHPNMHLQTAYNLDDGEKAKIRNNIGAVSEAEVDEKIYESKSTASDKIVKEEVIAAIPTRAILSVDAHDVGASAYIVVEEQDRDDGKWYRTQYRELWDKYDYPNLDLMTATTLTDEEKAKILDNIGAASWDEHVTLLTENGSDHDDFNDRIIDIEASIGDIDTALDAILNSLNTSIGGDV